MDKEIWLRMTDDHMMIMGRTYELKQLLNRSTIALIAIGIIAIVIGIAILWNQRKIKKMLRKLIEAQEARVEPGGEEPKEEP